MSMWMRYCCKKIHHIIIMPLWCMCLRMYSMLLDRGLGLVVQFICKYLGLCSWSSRTFIRCWRCSYQVVDHVNNMDTNHLWTASSGHKAKRQGQATLVLQNTLVYRSTITLRITSAPIYDVGDSQSLDDLSQQSWRSDADILELTCSSWIKDGLVILGILGER